MTIAVSSHDLENNFEFVERAFAGNVVEAVPERPERPDDGNRSTIDDVLHERKIVPVRMSDVVETVAKIDTRGVESNDEFRTRLREHASALVEKCAAGVHRDGSTGRCTDVSNPHWHVMSILKAPFQTKCQTDDFNSPEPSSASNSVPRLAP